MHTDIAVLRSVDLPRVSDEVQRAIRLEGSVALLAPLGFGKTTALQHLSHAFPGPVGWLTMTRGYEAPGHLIEALRGTVAGLVGSAPGVTDGAPRLSLSGALRQLGCRATESLLVIDDIDVVADCDASIDLLLYTIGRAPSNLRVAFAASNRFDALAPIIKNGVRSLGNQELALHTDEIDKLLWVTPLRTRLDGASMGALTGGWPLVVWRAVEALIVRPDLASDVDSTVEDSAWPTVQRMVSAVSPELKKNAVLLASLPWFDRDLARLACGRDVLDHVVDQFPIVRVSGATVSAGDLVGRCVARRLGQEFASESLSRIREWYLRKEDWGAAVELMLRHDPGGAAEGHLLRAVEQKSHRGLWREIVSLEAEWRRRGPGVPIAVDIARAEAQLHLGRNIEAADIAATCLADGNIDGEQRGRLLLVRTIALQQCGRPVMALRESDALHGLVPHLSPAQRINALRNAGACHGRALNVDMAAGYMMQALELADLEEAAEESVLIAIDLSALQLLRGHAHLALSIASDAVAMTRNGPWPAAAGLALNNFAAAAVILGQYGAAAVALDEASQCAVLDTDPRVRALICGTRGELLLDRGEPAKALESLLQARRLAVAVSDNDLELWCLGVEAQAHIELGDTVAACADAARIRELQSICSPLWKYSCIATEVRLWLELGEVDVAMRLCTSLVHDLERLPLALDRARALVLLGWLLYRKGGVQAAETPLRQACEAIEVVGSNSCLSRYVRSMHDMFRALRTPELEGIEKCLTAPGTFASYTPQHGHSTASPTDPNPDVMSERELELIVALCEGLNRDEVCVRMRLSRSTIDKVISQLYSVTGFTSCHQLVAWGYRCGIYHVKRDSLLLN